MINKAVIKIAAIATMPLLSFIFAMGAVAEENKKPNVMVILIDDMGYSDLGCYGSEIKTPNIDQLASNGLRFSQFYNTARCWPTRAAVLSGYYAQQVNRDKVLGFGSVGERPKWAGLLPEHLAKGGYVSYHSGKWHIDGAPKQAGFNRSYGIGKMGCDDNRFFDSKPWQEDDLRSDEKYDKAPYYSTVAITDHAIACQQLHHEQHGDQPFFQYIAYYAPHFPLHAMAEDIEEVGDRYKGGWDTIRSQRWKKLKDLGLVKNIPLSEVEYEQGPPYAFPDAIKQLGPGELNRPKLWEELDDTQKDFQQKKMAIHAAMIERVDKEVGRIVKQLKANQVYEDTAIFILSDNGASAEIMVRGDGHDPKAAAGSAKSYLCLGPGWSTVSNTPFRKHKTWTHEGGVSTPMITHYPRGIAKDQQGQIREGTGHVIDIAPTIMELAGLSREDPKVPWPGQSVVPTFNESKVDSRVLWWAHGNHHAIRDGDWKLVTLRDGQPELYDLSVDRAETNNLAAAKPEKVLAMQQNWNAMTEDMRKLYKSKP